MQRKIITTADGSKTISLPEWNEQYHSKHGALLEADYVFIKQGLNHYIKTNTNLNDISILEVGFGTGLNAYLTLLEAESIQVVPINYTGIEAYPISKEELQQLNYPMLVVNKLSDDSFDKLHQSNWEIQIPITSNFELKKQKKMFQDIVDKNIYDIIYFDAFGARVQPELWTEQIFKQMYNALKTNGILVTYAAKGSVRRAMLTTGFLVERLPGPPGKREMLRARKP